MNFSPLYHVDLYLVLVLYFGLLCLAAVFGYRKGKTSTPEIVPSSLLGLLALMLGFSFSMSLTRYENRKQVMVREANAIETTWLRAGLLAANQVAPTRTKLLEYLEHRVAFPGGAATQEEISKYQTRTGELQSALWAIAQSESTRDRTVTTSMFTQSLNEMIDISTERMFFLQDHVPGLVYLVIFALAFASLYSLGQVHGQKGSGRGPLIIMALLLCLVLGLIQDIDRPARGIIQVSPQLLIDLHESLKSRNG